MNNSCVIGIDIGGTNFRIGAVNEQNQVMHFRKIPTPTVFHTEDAMTDLTVYMKEYCQMLTEDGWQVQAIAIGFPTTINRERTMVLQAPNVPFMENMPVVEVLGRELGIPTFIERDVTMALLYDQMKYELTDCENLAGIYFGTGLGNALLINGKMVIGRNGTAGELGHIPVDGNDLQCGCGNIGCMETVAAGRYLTYLCQEVFTHTKVADIFTEHKEHELLKQFVDRMAIAVTTEINVLNPDYVLIGGGVPDMKDFPRDYLMERILVRTRKPYPAEDLQVIFTQDTEDKCVIGAAAYARSVIKK